MIEIYVAIITSIVAPCLMVAIQKMARSRKALLEELRHEMKQHRRDSLRLQILQLIHHDPKNRDTILNLLDEYHSLGGNSYIDDVAARWRKSLNKARK